MAELLLTGMRADDGDNQEEGTAWLPRSVNICQSLSEREAHPDRSVPLVAIPVLSSGGEVVDGQNRHIVRGAPQMQSGRQLACRPQ
jgi:hypothetical protein